jgi:hypothetical protein
MAVTLPYLAAPGSIKTALERIRSAATPDRVTRDFISTKLQIKGGTGAALIPFLKKIGFVASDGTPTELYKQFRNSSTGGSAVATAIKTGYQPLGEVNEYFYEASDKELQNLILQVTGAEDGNQVAKLTFGTLKALKSFADFDGTKLVEEQPSRAVAPTGPVNASVPLNQMGRVGLNLGYTFNLNLPATSDQAVFNAIFRSLKEHLLSDEQ